MRVHNIFRIVVGAAAIALLTASSAPVAAFQASADPAVAGEDGPQAAGVLVNPHRLQASPHAPGPGQVREVPRLYPVDDATFGLLKARANAAAPAAPHVPGAPPASAPAPQFPTVDFSDAGRWNPPDGALAVGPTSVVVAVNEALAAYSRTGALWAPGVVSLQSLFDLPGASVFDPRALYDKASGHFVLLAVTANSSTRTSYYTLAVSRNSAPLNAATDWCTYKLDAATGSGGARTWADFPGLGTDGNNVYITSNQFAFGSNRFQYARLLVLPKASVYPGPSGCPTATSTDFRNLKNPDGSSAFSVQPASAPDSPTGQTELHLVNAIWASGSNLALRKVTSTATGTPQLSAPTWVAAGDGAIGFYDIPADAQQPAGPAIESGDTRLSSAVYRYGAIYTANTTRTVDQTRVTNSVTPNAYANVQWYRVTPSGSAYVGRTWAASSQDVAYYFPGVLPGCTTAATGSSCAVPFVALELSGSGPAQAAAAYRARDTAAPQPYASGVSAYSLNGRWGDYPAVAADPTDATAVWLLGQYAKATSAWGTAVGQVTPSTP